MKLFGVTGHPVLHSRSPRIFNRLFSSRGLGAAYTRIGALTAADALSLAHRIGMVGFNVTSPFKEAMHHLAAARDDCAGRLGAANIVMIDASGTMAFNTDPDGVGHALAVGGIAVRGTQVVVLGAGGAARAAAHALVSEGASVVITSRTVDRARDAALRLGCEWAELARLPGLLASATGLVSCLPMDVDVVDERWLHPGLWVLDANYHRSALAGKARQHGSVVLSGVGWLVGQAAAAYRVFVGPPPAAGDRSPGSGDRVATEIARIVTESDDGAARPEGLALAGAAGAGTRTVGAEVARRLGREFVDADRLVAERTGHDLAWLRTHRGVNEVRQIEANAIRRAANGRPTVVALDADSLGDATAVAEIRQLYRTVWLWASPARLPHAASVDLVVDGERPPGEIVDLLEFEIRHVEK